jgi:superoxide reductase
MKNIKIYRCNICGNIILKLKDASEALVCCNQPMNLLVANVDGAKEKHLPIITAKTNHSLTIQIGSTVHPMTAEHYIE